MMDASTLVATLAGGTLLLVAAGHDVVARTVPNRLTLAIAGAGLAVQALQGSLLVSLPVAVAVFVLAALGWRRGWMGGGDVKLLGAVALLVPPALVPSLIAAIALSGGVLALAYLVARRRLPRPPGGRPHGLAARAFRAERWRLRRGGPMPYAVAIASGVFFILSQGGLP